MTTPTPAEALPDPSLSAMAADLQDERLIQRNGLRGAFQAAWSRIRTGDLGSLPVVIGLIVIWVAFQLLNENFLSPTNLVNLTLQCAAVGTIAIGIVLVLLLGEIDLSVGSVSGLASAILAVGFVNMEWPLALALLAAVAAGVLVGLLYGILYTRFGVPSFVITLAGLLGFLGLQLYVLGSTGSINIPFDSWIVQFASQWFLPEWLAYVLVVLVVVTFAAQAWVTARQRQVAGLSAAATSVLVAKSVGLLVVLGVPTWYLNQGRGVGLMFLLFLVFVVVMNFFLTRTRWGRSVYAIGGNVEAARRAGIKVKQVYVSIFVLCSTFAAIGGILAAGRLAAANQGSGGGDTNLNAIAAAVIGGASLFGGRGTAYSALLGILVIQSISSGLTLLNLDSSIRYMITGAVLLLAVIVDSVSRRSRVTHGRA
ncbi:ABC transporter permease [Cryobacterium roopkundense]|uniref:Xylose transport system permease protein XylH n=1 Tax=Cryobacterium roopkundense TaxID=1001240 RepID=A0A099JCG6_9MICO|nr:ABC transporter permease [Cryobacterium roopkundense]KGJ75168.1 ABC transporter permease [Cryobacterium roopkundense]MBB5642974.1 simple sugar transport system permease protein/D-xylose transport system permease protein [Cryobacterium roopkundense]